jgi:hypothetical protein
MWKGVEVRQRSDGKREGSIMNQLKEDSTLIRSPKIPHMRYFRAVFGSEPLSLCRGTATGAVDITPIFHLRRFGSRLSRLAIIIL